MQLRMNVANLISAHCNTPWGVFAPQIRVDRAHLPYIAHVFSFESVLDLAITMLIAIWEVAISFFGLVRCD